MKKRLKKKLNKKLAERPVFLIEFDRIWKNILLKEFTKEKRLTGLLAGFYISSI